MKTLKKAIALIALLTFLSACASSTSVDSPLPRRKTGCKGITGIQRAQCLENSAKIWEERENATGKETVLRKSKDGSTSSEKSRLCWSDFCRDFHRSWHTPTLKTYLIVGGVMLAVGFAGGVAAANVIVAKLKVAVGLLL